MYNCEPCLKQPLKNRQNIDCKETGSLVQVKKIADPGALSDKDLINIFLGL